MSGGTYKDDETTALLYAEQCENAVKLYAYTDPKIRSQIFQSIILAAIVEARKRSKENGNG